MVDSPNDALQSHKVLARNSQGPKSRENPENLEKLSPGEEGGGGKGDTGVGDHLGTIRHISFSIDGTSPKLLSQIALMTPFKHTKFQVETHPGAGSVGKKVLKIPKKS